MSIKNIKARKKYWKSLPKEVKSQRMSEIAKKRWNNATFEEKQNQGRRLILTRKKLKTGTYSNPAENK